MTYLLLGEDNAAKNAGIDELKKEYLSSPDAFHFDYEVFYGKKLDPLSLERAFRTLPIIAAKRLIVLREIHDFSERAQQILLEFIRRKEEKIILILESAEESARGSFMDELSSYAKVKYFRGKVKYNTFDMTKAMEQRKPVDALTILSDLLGTGAHPLQIMGGLVWFWGRLRNRLSGDGFKKGLMVLQQADLNIKRSRFNPEYVLETTVVKLTQII